MTSRWRDADGWAALATGTAYLVLARLAAGEPGPAEKRAFGTANGEGAVPVLRVPQQLGTPWLLPALSLLGALTHRPHLLVSAAVALPAEKVVEHLTKPLAGRPRPARAVAASLHDDAPADGTSFPSGHAAVVTCGAVLVAPHLPTAAVAPLVLTGVLTACTRVHQGEHFPLDVAGGALLGAAVGSALAFVVGLPVQHG